MGKNFAQFNWEGHGGLSTSRKRFITFAWVFNAWGLVTFRNQPPERTNRGNVIHCSARNREGKSPLPSNGAGASDSNLWPRACSTSEISMAPADTITKTNESFITANRSARVPNWNRGT